MAASTSTTPMSIQVRVLTAAGVAGLDACVGVTRFGALVGFGTLVGLGASVGFGALVDLGALVGFGVLVDARERELRRGASVMSLSSQDAEDR
jgi:hypothetical protein